MRKVRRKIIRQGAGGSTMSLPIKWVREQRLDPGDELYVTQVNGSLHITPVKKHVKRTAEILFESSANSEIMQAVIDPYYQLGYERLVVETRSDEQKNILFEDLERNYFGFQITQEQGNKTVIERAQNDELRGSHMRKMFLIIKDTFAYVQKCIGQDKEINSENIANNTVSFKRNSNESKRKTARSNTGSITWSISHCLHLLQQQLHHIGLHYKAASQAEISVFNKAAAIFSLKYSAFFRQEKTQLQQLSKEAFLLQKEITFLLQQEDNRTSFLQSILEQVKVMQLLAVLLIEHIICQEELRE